MSMAEKDAAGLSNAKKEAELSQAQKTHLVARGGILLIIAILLQIAMNVDPATTQYARFVVIMFSGFAGVVGLHSLRKGW